MTNPILAPELLELLDSGDTATLRELAREHHPALIAQFVSALDSPDIWRVLTALETQQAAQLFSHLDLDHQVELATGSNRKAMARLLEAMAADDRADLVRRLDDTVQQELLPLVAHAQREDIRRLVAYREGTAGALMSSEYAAVSPALTTLVDITGLLIYFNITSMMLGV